MQLDWKMLFLRRSCFVVNFVSVQRTSILVLQELCAESVVLNLFFVLGIFWDWRSQIRMGFVFVEQVKAGCFINSRVCIMVNDYFIMLEEWESKENICT